MLVRREGGREEGKGREGKGVGEGEGRVLVRGREGCWCGGREGGMLVREREGGVLVSMPCVYSHPPPSPLPSPPIKDPVI